MASQLTFCGSRSLTFLQRLVLLDRQEAWLQWARGHIWSTRLCLPQQSPGRGPRAFVCSAVVLSQGIGPKGVGLSCALGWAWQQQWLCCQIRCSSIVGGAAGAGTWGQVSIGTFRWVRGTSGDAIDGDRAVQAEQPRHARNVRDPSRVLEQGPDRQRAPDWCSGGVSSICGASESRCHHDGPARPGKQASTPVRHRSLPAAIGLHEGGFRAPPAGAGGCPPGPAARPRCQRAPAAGAPAGRPPSRGQSRSSR